jgi:hypothetical protein
VDRAQDNVLASILEKLERIEEETTRLTALAHAFVTAEHREKFLTSAGQIWRDATAVGELANRVLRSSSES